MIKKIKEKENAIRLRRQGKTYSEILKVISIAKSTLSLWLKDVKLSKSQNQRFTIAKRLASLRGGQAKKKQRIEKQNKIILKAKSEIKHLSQHELFLIGVALYWAEGSKEKEYYPGSSIQFSNMDPKMIKVFIVWLIKICKIKRNMIQFDIFLHKNHMSRIMKVKKYWSKVTLFPITNFTDVYFKKNNIKKTNRKNIAENYYGSLKIIVKKSSSLVRKIAGWTDGIYEKVIKK